MQRSVLKQISHQGVFEDLFYHLSLRRLCFGGWHIPRSGGSRRSVSGDIARDGIGLPGKARDGSFFDSADSHDGLLVMRRVVLALLMAGLFVTSAWAQISLVQVTTCGPGTFPGTSCTIPASGSGHLIVVAWASGLGSTPTINSVTDNVGNTYTEAGAAWASVANSFMLDIWYAKNSTSNATTVTITPSASATGAAVIWEFSGVNTVSPLDQTAVLSSQPASATPSGAPVTTTAPNEVIVSVISPWYDPTGLQAGNPFTSDSLFWGAGWAHLLTSAVGSYTAQWDTPSGTYASSTVSFVAATSYSTCDLNEDGTVNILDVELATDMVLDSPPCTAPFGQCNDAFVQAVLTDAMPGGACVLPVLGVAPSSISFGNVTVGSSSTQTVTLTGTGTAGSTISQATVSGAGFSISGLSLPLTLTVGQTASFSVTFTPLTAGSVTGSIAFVSNALDAPVNQTLSGTGVTAVAHSVSLSWTPSTSSNIASYSIYRITSSSSTAPATPYPSLASISATTCSATACAYTDTSVQAGTSYWYYTAAVNTGGSVSVPSNIVQAVVPTP
jgi:hypothetical protein